MLKYKGANIQIMDVPGLIGGAADGRGDGTQVLSVVRNADLVLYVLDPEEMRVDTIKQEIYNAGIRTNTTPPDVKIEKKDRGAINISSTVDLSVQDETIKQVMRDNGYINAEVIIREDVDIDGFIDVMNSNRVYMPAVTVVNKADMLSEQEKQELDADIDLFISAEEEINLNELREMIFDKLGLIRIYMKEKGEEADKDEPLILREGDTVEEALDTLPGDMRDRFKKAKVTGTSSKFPNQKVGMEHQLEDEDILELNLRHI
jgi:ribosome-interacting GTPase 1